MQYLHLHTPSHSTDCLPSRQIGDVYEGIVERGEDSGDAEDEFTLSDCEFTFEMRLELQSAFGAGRVDRADVRTAELERGWV